jgi:hypothetical protein
VSPAGTSQQQGTLVGDLAGDDEAGDLQLGVRVVGDPILRATEAAGGRVTAD